MLSGSDRFRIEREIADTLQGRIYAGTDLLTKKAVVIKEAWRQLVHSGRSRKGHRVPEDFLKERKLIMSLTSLPDCTPGLVRGIDEWDDDHCYYYAMEFCEGELFDYINSTHTQTDYRQFVDTESKKEQIPMTRPNKWVVNVAKMFKQICEAVQWLHLKGYCHLDLSLENTMISDLTNLKVKVIDLGLTQQFNNNDFRFQGRVGKLQYMCPEAYARKVYNAKAADVYCLGVMLFMMLIGAPPYQAPQAQNAAFSYFVAGRAGDVLKHWKRLRLITADALDLLNNMLRYENNRISLDAVLQHPFFTSLDETDLDQESNPMQIEEKNDSDTNVVAAVDKISSDVSQMLLVDDDSKEEEEEEEENEDNNNHNTWCDMLLQEWGLEEISHTLHSAGWSDPNQWDQLTLYALKFEIGLNDQQSQSFINHIKHEFGSRRQQNKCNINHNIDKHDNHDDDDNDDKGGNGNNDGNDNNNNTNNTANRPKPQQKRQKQQKQQKYRHNQRNYSPKQQQQYRQKPQDQRHHTHQVEHQHHRQHQHRQQQQHNTYNTYNAHNRQNHNRHTNHPNPYSHNNYYSNNNNDNNTNPNHRQHPNPNPNQQQHKHPH